MARSGTVWSRVSTVELPSNVEDMRLTVRTWTTGRREPGSVGAFDVGVLDLADDGTFVDGTQTENIVASILDARAHAPVDGQPVVVVFVHGWHHNSEWRRSATIRPGEDDGDPHFAAFREALRRLVLREEERPDAVDAPSRRVIGVYVGWRGDWRWFGTSRRLRTFLSFWGRYRTARGIGRSPHLADAVGRIIEAVKAPLPASFGVPDSSRGQVGQLVVAGHSMGALIVEETLHARVTGGSTTGHGPASDPPLFPDLMLALNSAADSRILAEIVDRMKVLGMKKQKFGGAVAYSPPMLISATSVADCETRVLWRLSQGIHVFRRRTDGHDPDLRTHSLTSGPIVEGCKALVGVLDHGQSWHCLRPPVQPRVPTPDIPIDLPTVERNVKVEHRRYTLTARDRTAPELAWVIEVPAAVIPSHNEIFGATALSLILALIQVSGAVAGLARDWDHTFEPE